ncbi:glucosaminidase domain-containing protein [Epilithonimonas arachidiradicis]|uniref:Flagellum-specific peptidoglycan hydrolase FlgJ n=2 Tax=Epilithonimonas arachidiradicis TaxID=1617282 RepID=A0A420DAD7_9FLAO|nr:glucosaminidase domain-containing protein [Epilithonimonas arachidiradicis]RKE87784.1 flagellum-specific peptidoglycan hydrolase FlgJ [Epilithonimonas arachidiradicis]
MRNFHIRLLMIFSLFFSLKISAQNSYINQYKPFATELSQEFGIPISVILSIAYMETGGGTSSACKVLNNHFGMTGKNAINSSRFKSFTDSKASYRAFCEWVSKRKFYEKLKGSQNHNEWFVAIASSGYSTKPMEWKQKLNLVMKKIGF